jgi:hypothetical protein
MWAIAKQKTNQDRKLPVWQRPIALIMAIVLMLGLTACGGDRPAAVSKAKKVESGSIVEVSPPLEIQRLNNALDKYEPQLTIVSPKPDTIIQDDKITVQLSVTDLPVFKSSAFGLGPHVHVTLDGQEYQPLYDLNQTLTFANLTPGSHTIRAFASRPWHESFKNEGAYAQTTFHVYAKTGENTPNPQQPLLTYSRPVGSYGAEPILLDFYLRNAPLHIAALEDSDLNDWLIRATINGQSFEMENWQPLYLRGFKPGKNWVKLEFLDRNGNLIPNQFNSTVHSIDYQPGGQDTLSRLMRGEKIADIDKIVDPNYIAAPATTPSPTPSPTVSPAQESAPLTVQPTPSPSPTTQPTEATPSPEAVTKQEQPKVAPQPLPPITQPSVIPIPVPIPKPEAPKVAPQPLTPTTQPSTASPKKAEKKSEQTGWQGMFNKFKEKVTPKQESPKVTPPKIEQVEKISPQPVTKPAPVVEPKVTPATKQLEPPAATKPAVTTESPQKTLPKTPPQTLPVTVEPKLEVKRESPKLKTEPKLEVKKVAPKPELPKAAPAPVLAPKTIAPTPETKQPFAPAQPKAKVEEKSERPGWQKMFDRFKEKVTPKTESPKVLPVIPITKPTIAPVEPSTPPKVEPKVEIKKVKPKVEVKKEAPKSSLLKAPAPVPVLAPKAIAPTPEVKQPFAPAQPKAKVEEKSERPGWQTMFDRFKEKVTPKTESPKVAPVAPMAKPAIAPIKSSAPPEVEPKIEVKKETPKQDSGKASIPEPIVTPKALSPNPITSTRQIPPQKLTSWQERLRQLRESGSSDSGVKSSGTSSEGAIPVPESL